MMSILLCITSLCSVTWAWFTAGEESTGNVISSGKFELEVTVLNSLGEEITPTLTDGGKTVFTLDADTYSVTLTITDGATVKKGFATVSAGENSYKTASVNIDGANPLPFLLDVGRDNTTVTFLSTWGLPAEPDVNKNGTLTIEYK